jgi:hypothetical protein
MAIGKPGRPEDPSAALLEALDAAGVNVVSVARCQWNDDRAISGPSGTAATLVFVDNDVRWAPSGIAEVGGGCWAGPIGGSYVRLRAQKFSGRWIVHAEAGAVSGAAQKFREPPNEFLARGISQATSST